MQVCNTARAIGGMCCICCPHPPGTRGSSAGPEQSRREAWRRGGACSSHYHPRRDLQEARGAHEKAAGGSNWQKLSERFPMNKIFFSLRRYFIAN